MKLRKGILRYLLMALCIVSLISTAVFAGSYPAKNSNDPGITKNTSFTVTFKFTGKNMEKEIEKFKGKNILTSGDAVGDFIIGEIVGQKVKIPGVVGATFGFTSAVVTKALDEREAQIDKVLKEIYKGAKGMQVTATCKPCGYPVVDLKFSSYK